MARNEEAPRFSDGETVLGIVGDCLLSLQVAQSELDEGVQVGLARGDRQIRRIVDLQGLLLVIS